MSDNTLNLIKDNDVRWVDLRFTDPRGKEQHTTIPARRAVENYRAFAGTNAVERLFAECVGSPVFNHELLVEVGTGLNHICAGKLRTRTTTIEQNQSFHPPLPRAGVILLRTVVTGFLESNLG